jgi:predicted metal-binding membrane protein
MVFLGLSALLFAGSVATTVVWCASMAAMGGMAMPGGWTKSMTWMRMPGQTWPGTAASFLAMWVVMTAAMMLPSFVPLLWRYQHAVERTVDTRLGWRTAAVGVGYFGIWALVGLAVFPLGAAVAAILMRCPALSREAPLTAGVIVLLSGATQFTAWKRRHLACCRWPLEPARAIVDDARAAVRLGLRLGLHCAAASLGLTGMLLVMGVMDLRVMAVVTVAVTLERLAPAGDRVAHGVGAGVVGAGALLVAQAAGFG